MAPAGRPDGFHRGSITCCLPDRHDRIGAAGKTTPASDAHILLRCPLRRFV
jgi:hypothetical protein